MHKFILPPPQGPYRCEHLSANIVDVFDGKTWIGSLWTNPYYTQWGVCETMKLVDSPNSRLTSKEDLLYFIACLEFLNAQHK